MLKKLLKYDLKSVFKYWWIAAITTFGVSFLGGYALTILRDADSTETARAVPLILEILATISIPLVYLVFAALAILTIILVFLRYYKNFYSDEGYLTFTLPVKKTELINSKLIMGILSSLATILVIAFDVLIILCVGFSDKILDPLFWKDFANFFSEMYKTLGGYTFVYAIEIIVMLLAISLFSTLFLYDCVAIASMLVKKAKVITAIGIYYAANGAISAIYTIFTIFGMSNILDIMADMNKATLLPLIALLWLGIIVMVAMFAALLYLLQYWIVDRKLNLS